MRSLPAVSASAHSICSTSSSGTGAVAAADEAQPHALLVQLGRLAVDVLGEHPHERLDLVDRARPVLGRERVDVSSSIPSSTASRSRAFTFSAPARWPSVDRQAALLGPAAVAVGDDRDVARAGGRRRRRRARSAGRSDLEDLFLFVLQQRRRARATFSSVSFCSSPSARCSSSAPASPGVAQLAQVVHHVAADVADRDAALLGDPAHDLDELACGAPRSARG